MAKILLVDDSRLARNTLKRILQEGHTLSEASDGVQAIEQYYVEKPDLVILDLTMPRMHGLEVLKQIRRIDPDALVIIGTADIQDRTQQRARELGAAAVIHKPFQADAVKQIVTKVLQGRMT
ncbi:MAG: response regulator [Anaerolineae bacterium]|nr:response regulator [Anaerolineae bacterium]